MHKVYCFAALVIGIPHSSHAQTSSTQCYKLGNTVQCNTFTPQTITPAPPVNWGALNQPQQPQNGVQDVLDSFHRTREAQAQRQEAARRFSDQVAAQNRSEGIRKTVSILLKNNDCEAALRYSLDAGDVGLATQVKQFCAKP